MPRSPKFGRSVRHNRAARPLVWIGGRLPSPFEVDDRDLPYRPDLVLWLEPESGVVVGMSIIHPSDAPGSVARILQDAMARPLIGLPRRPDVIRVADAALAAEIRSTIGDAIPITVVPTPELDEIMKAFAESMGDPDQDASYLEDGLLAPEAVGAFFAEAQILFEVAPWEVVVDSQVVRLDIPDLEVDGACLSIIGNLGELSGFLIFPSYAGYEAFVEASETHGGAGHRPDFGSDWIALTYDRGADLPDAMRREVVTHGWPVAAADAYPRAQRYDRAGCQQPLDARSLEIVTACAASFGDFFVEHRAMFEADEVDAVCESYFDADEREVRFTAPYEAHEAFPVNTTSARTPISPVRRPESKVGRNDPCPCGSGRKYKNCHLRQVEETRSAESEYVESRSIEDDLLEDLARFAGTRFGMDWSGHAGDFADPRGSMQLAEPWGLFHYRVNGRTVLDWYLEDRGSRLSRRQRAWLAAQQAAWLSVWEVLEVVPGQSATLHDLLSGETRQVLERSGTRLLVPRDAVLGRIIEDNGIAMFSGVHPRPLPPYEAAEVVRRARGKLRLRRDVPADRLRDESNGRFLIKRWEEAVAAFDARCAVPPKLTNTDGEPLLLTTDHFTITPGARPQVAERLATVEGMDAPGPDDDDPSVYDVLRPGNPVHKGWDNTVLGHVFLSDATVRLETNSQQRADALRARLESACGDLIHHEKRESTDPRSLLAERGREGALPAPSSPEIAQLTLEYKKRHYATWVDQPLPALNNQAPREAVKTAAGRVAVDLLLKDCENREQRTTQGPPFDFSEIRRTLGLV
jgi:hypothetical protein